MASDSAWSGDKLAVVQGKGNCTAVGQFERGKVGLAENRRIGIGGGRRCFGAIVGRNGYKTVLERVLVVVCNMGVRRLLH